MTEFKIVGTDVKITAKEISDGYHTFDELYDHRCLLFINLCLMQVDRCAWKKDYPDWFCLYLETDYGQISYHIPEKYLPLIIDKIRLEQSYEWTVILLRMF